MKYAPRQACLLLLAAALACRSAFGAVFDFSDAASAGHGTEASTVVLQDTRLDTGKALNRSESRFTRSAAPTVSNNVTTTTWQSETGGVTAKCTTAQSATDLTMELTVTNGWTHRLEALDFRLPEIATALDPANRIMSPMRGGVVTKWETTEWKNGQGNTAAWPSTAFSPLLTLWNERTADTLAITYFNKSLAPVMIFWFSGPDGTGKRQCLNPMLRATPNLMPGQSITFTVEYHFMTGGPAAHQKRYREETLTPFMKELNIPEATYDLGAPGAPVAMSPWIEPALMKANMAAAVAAGANTYIQWATPDGRSLYYNPYPAHFPWFNTLAVSRQVPGLAHVGVLIVPFVSPPMRADRIALLNEGPDSAAAKAGQGPDTNLHLNPQAPDVRRYLARLRDELVARNVSIAYWDTGSGPEFEHGHAWLQLLASWKAAGIAIMPETSCDLAAWTTGLWMEYPYSWGTYSMMQIVTPKAALAAHTNFPDTRTIDGTPRDWKADARLKNLHPIVDVAELKRPTK